MTQLEMLTATRTNGGHRFSVMSSSQKLNIFPNSRRTNGRLIRVLCDAENAKTFTK